MNALNGVSSDTYILEIKIEQEFDKDFAKRLDFKDIKFQ